MREVPWWFATIAHVLAVALSVWLGMHARAGVPWLALYGAAAIACAVLPARRLAGVLAFAVGVAVASGGMILLRDAHVALGDVVSAAGGALAPAREAIALAITSVWLLAAAALRFRWL